MLLRMLRTAIALVIAIELYGSSSSSAQIVELREFHGKQIACARSGLSSFEMSCGIDSWYEDIFLGAVLSVSEAEHSEKTLNITAEEIFLGNPPGELAVVTNQADCFGDIAPGDQWLFYLRRDEKTGKLIAAYKSPSGPIAGRERTISLLRRLLKMTDTGVIRGDVALPIREADHSENWTYPPSHKVVAKRAEDGIEYAAFTDHSGDYEFDPLPAGSYDLSANTTQGLWAEEGRVEVKPRGCSSVRFELYPDTSISGWVTSASGKPIRYAPVEIAPLDGQSRWGLTTADEHGYFEVRGLEPGHYLVGIDIQGNQGGLVARAKAYYPGVRDRNLAIAVVLGRGEKRTHVDFHIPASGVP